MFIELLSEPDQSVIPILGKILKTNSKKLSTIGFSVECFIAIFSPIF